MDSKEIPFELKRSDLLQVFQNAPIPLALHIGPDHRCVLANALFLDLQIQNIRRAHDLSPSIEQLNRVYRSGKPESEEAIKVVIPDRTGCEQERYFRFTLQPLKKLDGQVFGILSLAVEVTAERDASERLDQQKAWLQTILDKLPIGVVVTRAESGEFLQANKKATEMYGQEFPLQHPVREFEHHVEAFDLKGHRLAKKSLPLRRAARGEVIASETVLWKSPSGQYYVTISSDRIPALRGNPEAMVVPIIDVTESKQVEMDLESSRSAFQRSEERLTMAIETSLIGLWEYDILSAQFFWNEQFAKQWDFDEGRDYGSYDEIVGKLHEDDRAKVKEAATKLFNGNENSFMQFRIMARVGIRWIEARAKLIRNAKGHPTRISGTTLDCTEAKSIQDELRKAKEQAEFANSAKTAFLANMSHEIRTPLTAIIGYVDLLRDPMLSPKDRETCIEIVTRNGRALAKLIDDILDLSKIEAGRLETDIIPFSLAALIEEIRQLFAETTINKGIYLTTLIHPDVPPFFLSDPLRLRQILVNIVGNAVKFTSVGYVAIQVSAKAIDDETYDLFFAVEDSGPGLTTEQKKRLFQPFVQADNSISRRYGGTGLGLALSARLANALGGKISIFDSSAASGCRFVVSIRGKKCQENHLDLVENVNVPDDHALEGLKILLVEDAPDNRLLISSVLDRFGATVLTANDGVDGVQLALNENFDVILMDIQMPRMDGYTAIRSLNSQNYRVPIIAMTAHVMKEDREEAQAAGFAGHISKPIQIPELVATVLACTKHGKSQYEKDGSRKPTLH